MALVNRGGLWLEKNEHDKAMADLSEAIRVNPKAANAYNNRACVWVCKGEYDRSIADYSEAIRIDPRHGESYKGRGSVWCMKQEYERALSDFSEAIRIEPNDVEAYSKRLRTPGPPKAITTRRSRSATRALRIKPRSRSLLVRGRNWLEKKELVRA